MPGHDKLRTIGLLAGTTRTWRDIHGGEQENVVGNFTGGRLDRTFIAGSMPLTLSDHNQAAISKKMALRERQSKV